MTFPSPASTTRRLAALVLVAFATIGTGEARPFETAVLERPGIAAELRGRGSRVIAFYDRQGRDIELTLLIAGVATGGEVLRSRVRLRDGQRHVLRLAGATEGQGADRYEAERAGNDVRLFVDTGPGPDGRTAELALPDRD